VTDQNWDFAEVRQGWEVNQHQQLNCFKSIEHDTY